MTTVRRFSFVGFAILLLGLFAACGGDDGGLDTSYPPAGDDVFDRTTATVEIEITFPGVSALPVGGAGFETIDLSGPLTVTRSDPYEGDNGLATVDTEIVSMELTGEATFGTVIVRPNPDIPSRGKVIQQEAGQDFPADSFFDVYTEVELVDLDITARTDEPMRMEATLTDLPPGVGTEDGEDDVYRLSTGEPVPLIPVTPGSLAIGRISDAVHIPNPPPENGEPPKATPTPEPEATPTPEPTSEPTEEPTDDGGPPDVGGTYPGCTLEPQEGPGLIHIEFIELPESLDLDVSQTDDILIIDAPGVPQWVPVSGTLFPDGGFQGTGMGDVAGFPDTQVQVDGFFGPQGFSGTAQYGVGGELPGGDPAIYDWQDCPPGP